MIFWLTLIFVGLALLLGVIGVLYTIYRAITKPHRFLSDELNRKTGIRINF